MKKVQELVKKCLATKKGILIAIGISSTTIVACVAGFFVFGNDAEFLDEVGFIASNSDREASTVTKSEDLISIDKDGDNGMKYSNLLAELAGLGVDITGRETPEESKLENAIESLKKEIEEKKQEIASKDNFEEVREEEEIVEEVVNDEIVDESVNNSNNNSVNNSTNSSNSDLNNSSSNSGSTQQKPVEQPSTPPVVEQKPVEETPSTPPVVEAPAPSVPSIASGWKDDIAQQVTNEICRSKANKPEGVYEYYTAGQYAMLLSEVQGWFNGSGATMSSINAKMDANRNEWGSSIELTWMGSFNVSGLDVYSIRAGIDINTGMANRNHFVFVKVYYDANTDTSTVYFAGGCVG